MEPKQKPWWVRYQIFVTFFLTTIVGASVTTLYQMLSTHYEQAREIRQTKYSEVKDFFLDFSETAESRNYYLYREISLLEDIASGTNVQLNEKLLPETRDQYRKATEEWNLKWNYYRVMISYHLGEKLGNQFYEQDKGDCLVNRFRKVHSMVYSIMNDYDAGKPLDLKAIENAKHEREVIAVSLYNTYQEILTYLTKVNAE